MHLHHRAHDGEPQAAARITTELPGGEYLTVFSMRLSISVIRPCRSPLIVTAAGASSSAPQRASHFCIACSYFFLLLRTKVTFSVTRYSTILPFSTITF